MLVKIESAYDKWTPSCFSSVFDLIYLIAVYIIPLERNQF